MGYYLGKAEVTDSIEWIHECQLNLEFDDHLPGKAKGLLRYGVLGLRQTFERLGTSKREPSSYFIPSVKMRRELIQMLSNTIQEFRSLGQNRPYVVADPLESLLNGLIVFRDEVTAAALATDE